MEAPKVVQRFEVHVVPAKSVHGWRVLSAFAAPVTSLQSEHRFKFAAVREARKLAKRMHGELFIHGRDGKIQDRSSYGNDPPGRG